MCAVLQSFESRRNEKVEKVVYDVKLIRDRDLHTCHTEIPKAHEKVGAVTQ